jgi:hypothetical protein
MLLLAGLRPGNRLTGGGLHFLRHLVQEICCFKNCCSVDLQPFFFFLPPPFSTSYATHPMLLVEVLDPTKGRGNSASRRTRHLYKKRPEQLLGF